MTKMMLMAGCLALIATAAAAEPQNIRQSLKRHADTAITTQTPAIRNVPHPPRAPSSGWSKVLFGVLGGVGGFFAGGYLGAAIEGNSCRCDDPGLKGALIGAPIGAIAGAAVGVALAR
jgi:hypothetical protein